MKRRAFTMIELVTSLALISLVSTACMALLFGWSGMVNSVTLQVQRELDARRAALRIFQAARAGAQIFPDQTGMRFANGSQLIWREQQLLLAGHSLFSEPVRGFAVVRQQGRLHLTFELAGQRTYRGPVRSQRFEYDQEKP
jgi:prepilin-type N-terminal cleavage/methylation domain-containing protein